uniref:glycosyltransferase family 8 protein n=1 Tax=Bacteroides sp. TaxID=29523 RepID=UPI0026017C5A
MDKSDSIHIVLASDDAYIQHLGTLLISIFENNKEERFTIHLLLDGVSDNKRVLCSQIVEKYGQSLVYYEMDKSLFHKFPLRAKDHISIASYYRLKLPELLPKDLSHILYMDCDMIVTGKLRPLWDIDVTNVALAAVMDTLSFMPETFERLAYPMYDKYFNAGLLHINLDFWRQQNIFEEALQIAEEKADTLLWHDQDILNILFHGHWKNLPFRWNVMNTLMRPFPFYTTEVLHEINSEIAHRAVIHYTCAWK